VIDKMFCFFVVAGKDGELLIKMIQFAAAQIAVLTVMLNTVISTR
jgi:hypothetical protein